MIKTIAIDDFSGGRVNFRDQVLIQTNQCASGSFNVWAPEGALIKAPGYVLQSSFTASGLIQLPGFWTDDSVSTANKLFYRILGITATGNGVGPAVPIYPYGSAGLVDNLTPLGYTTGTLSISGASLISATGSGTLWLANVSAGDRLLVTAFGGGAYLVKSIEDDTHLTLNAAVPSQVGVGSTYTVQPYLQQVEMACASLNGSLCWSTTGDIFQRYDGTGITRLSAGPGAAYLANFKNYMFAGRTSTATSRLYWSAIKDPTSWPANNFIDIDVKNGNMSGVFSYGPELIVFKTRGMYKVIGDVFDPSNPTYYVVKINTPPDFVFDSNYSVAVHGKAMQSNFGYQIPGGALTFYGGGRIYKYSSGANFITDISPTIIRDLPTGFGTIYDAQGNVDQRIQAIAFRDHYIIKGMQDPNNGGRYMALILDPNGAWWYVRPNGITTTPNPIDIGKMAIVPNTSTRPQLATAMSGAAKVFTWDFVGPTYGVNDFDTSGSDYSSSVVGINGTWISKEFDIEFGIFKWITIYVKKQSAGNLTVQWSIDQAANVSYALDMTAGRGQIIRAVIPVNQKGSTIQITLSNSGTSQTFKVYGIKIFYEESHLERIY